MQRQSVLMISSYPPRSCGLATYAYDVVWGLINTGVRCEVLAVDEHPVERSLAFELWQSINDNDQQAYMKIAKAINDSEFTCVAVQHEFGIYGGPDGEWLLNLYTALEKPIVTTLHTVLAKPSANQRRILMEIARISKAIIVLSDISYRLLADEYGVKENVIIVSHGVPDVPFIKPAEAKRHFHYDFGKRPTVTTFGLISRGKGLDSAIEALKIVKARIPDVLYVIAGKTHPKVLEYEGESYRNEIKESITRNDLDDNVMFIDQFMPLPELLGLLAASDVYFTPYKEPNQVVSGTLAYAMGCGKAILSTPYLYAQELLGNGRGFLCGFSDTSDMAEKLTMLLSDTVLRARVEEAAYAYGRQMIWPNVSKKFAEIYSSAHTPDILPSPVQS